MNPIEPSNRLEGLSEFEPSTPIRNHPIGQRTLIEKRQSHL